MPATHSKEKQNVRKKSSSKKKVNPIYTVFWKLWPFHSGKQTETSKFDQEGATLDAQVLFAVHLVVFGAIGNKRRVLFAVCLVGVRHGSTEAS